MNNIEIETSLVVYIELKSGYMDDSLLYNKTLLEALIHAFIASLEIGEKCNVESEFRLISGKIFSDSEEAVTIPTKIQTIKNTIEHISRVEEDQLNALFRKVPWEKAFKFISTLIEYDLDTNFQISFKCVHFKNGFLIRKKSFII